MTTTTNTVRKKDWVAPDIRVLDVNLDTQAKGNTGQDGGGSSFSKS